MLLSQVSFQFCLQSKGILFTPFYINMWIKLLWNTHTHISVWLQVDHDQMSQVADRIISVADLEEGSEGGGGLIFAFDAWLPSKFPMTFHEGATVYGYFLEQEHLQLQDHIHLLIANDLQNPQAWFFWNFVCDCDCRFTWLQVIQKFVNSFNQLIDGGWFGYCLRLFEITSIKLGLRRKLVSTFFYLKMLITANWCWDCVFIKIHTCL